MKRYRAESHFNLARAYAVCARSDPERLGQAAGHLWSAFVSHPSYQILYAQDATFDPVREQIDAVLRCKLDPTAEHQRLVAETSARAH